MACGASVFLEWAVGRGRWAGKKEGDRGAGARVYCPLPTAHCLLM
jgi:hypothetical protein